MYDKKKKIIGLKREKYADISINISSEILFYVPLIYNTRHRLTLILLRIEAGTVSFSITLLY
jgi:hypothetical protein